MYLRRVALAIIAAVQPAAALSTAPADVRYQFRIPAGSLDEALRLYARTTGRQVLYRGAAISGRRFSGLLATLDADAALERILSGSGLRSLRPAPNVVVIEIVQVEVGPEVAVASGTTDDDLIIVTGTNIRGATPTTSTRTISRQEIERSGRATIADVIAAQPSNFGGTGNPVALLTGADRSGLNVSLAPGANLRGLGSEATLTLFDGRRVAGSGGRGDFTDLSAIPTMAVERVEMLVDGASAIYGSDAVGGVVNMVLRHRINGMEARLRAGSATDGSTRNVLGGLIGGRGWASGSVLIAYEFERRTALRSADRKYAATGDLRAFGGADRRLFYSSPATILAYDPVVGNYVPTFRVPVLPEGTTPTVEQLQPGSNLYNPIAGLDLSPSINRHTTYAYVGQELGPSVHAFIDARYAHRTFRYRSPASVAAIFISDANPFFLSPDGLPFSALAYSFFQEIGAGRSKGRVSALGLTGGFDWTPTRGWTVDGNVNYARERSRDRAYNIVNTTALDEALGVAPDDPLTAFNPTVDGYFNPYGSGTANSAKLLDFVGSGYARSRRRSGILDATLKADGPLVDIWGGAVRIALGASIRRESFRAGGETFYSGARPEPIAALNGRRTVKAAFAELNLPFVGDRNASRGFRLLTLSAAARTERYGDFGSTTNPKIGVAWSPAVGLVLRTNWGTSFRAPALAEINDRRSISPTQLPVDSGQYVPVILVGGGNPRLGPERATTWSAGVVIEPVPAPGLKLEVGLFSTRFRDRIAQPALQDLLRALRDPALDPFVSRIDPANIPSDLALVEGLLAEPNAFGSGGLPASAFEAIVDTRYVNTGRLSVSGLDAELSLDRTYGAHRLNVSLAASWLFRYAVQATPLATVVDRLDTLGNPLFLKIRTSGGWSANGWSATIFGNWSPGYRNDGVVPARRIGSFFTADMSLSVAPLAGLLRGMRLSLNVENLLNANPPFADRLSGIGFDAANASPFGRTVALELRRTF